MKLKNDALVKSTSVAKDCKATTITLINDCSGEEEGFQVDSPVWVKQESR